MKKQKIPIFETKRLILKEILVEHFENYTKHFVDYEVIKHLASGVPWPYPENGVKEYFDNIINPVLGISRWTWGIFLKECPNEVIGAVDLWRDGHPEHRGFWLGKEFWNRGIMSEACEPVTAFAFNELQFKKIVFANGVGNSRSRRVKEKAGAIFLRKEPANFVDQTYTEHEIWELTKESWQKN
jgi:RimJ/RimL family protein N-acetyltransferase